MLLNIAGNKNSRVILMSYVEILPAPKPPVTPSGIGTVEFADDGTKFRLASFDDKLILLAGEKEEEEGCCTIGACASEHLSSLSSALR